jgi:hypothetical protein
MRVPVSKLADIAALLQGQCTISSAALDELVISVAAVADQLVHRGARFTKGDAAGALQDTLATFAEATGINADGARQRDRERRKQALTEAGLLPPARGQG